MGPSFFLWSGWFRRRRVFSFSFSQALGKPKPIWFGFPLVFSSSCTRSPSTTRTSRSAPTPRPRPAPAFFFFSFRRRRVRFWFSVFARPCSVGVGFLGGCFSFFSASPPGLCFCLCAALQDRPRCLVSGAGRRDISRPSRFIIMAIFGVGCGTAAPHNSLVKVVRRAVYTPPRPPPAECRKGWPWRGEGDT